MCRVMEGSTAHTGQEAVPRRNHLSQLHWTAQGPQEHGSGREARLGQHIPRGTSPTAEPVTALLLHQASQRLLWLELEQGPARGLWVERHWPRSLS